jgi:membrane protease YdiL (CAAX protease family)
VDDIRYLVTAFVLVALLASVIGFTIWVIVLGRRGRLLPIPRLRPGVWTGREVALVFIFMELVRPFALAFFDGIGFFQEFYGNNPTNLQKGLWSTMLAFPITVAGTFLILFSLSRTRPRQLGLTTARLLQNVLLGCLAWFPLTLVTLGLFELVQPWLPAKEHPLEKMLKGQPIVVDAILVLAVVLLVAPFVEELIFRGVLLGWLRRCSLVGHMVLAGSTLFVAALPLVDIQAQSPERPQSLDFGPLVFAIVLVIAYLLIIRPIWIERKSTLQILPGQSTEQPSSNGVSTTLPVAEPAKSVQTLPDDSAEKEKRLRHLNSNAAIFGASMLWAVFHSTLWPAPVPLFFLGLGLGWLAYRTQSLASSITVHFLFNSVGCVLIAIGLFYGKENGNAQTDAGRPSVAGSNSTLVPGSWWPRFK